MKILIMLSLFLSGNALAGTLIPLKNEFFYIEYNCEKRGAEYFEYVATMDKGTLPRVHKFTQDPKIPKECRQFSTGTYKRKKGEKPSYDRGHIVEQNVMDQSLVAMKLTNMFSNIVPQISTLNRSGAWRQTEILTECYRDIGDLNVSGGVIWGDNSADDYFMESHGVPTPDYLYKIHYLASKGTQAWLIPNTEKASTMELDEFLISITDLESFTGRTFNVPEHYKANAPLHSWEKTKNCNLQ